MLEEVRITGLGVIDDVVLEPAPGLTVVTGETGAGKTMVVTGLGLLFGGRGDPARVRPGADRATVEGRLRIDPGGHVADQAGALGRHRRGHRLPPGRHGLEGLHGAHRRRAGPAENPRSRSAGFRVPPGGPDS